MELTPQEKEAVIWAVLNNVTIITKYDDVDTQFTDGYSGNISRHGFYFDTDTHKTVAEVCIVLYRLYNEKTDEIKAKLLDEFEKLAYVLIEEYDLSKELDTLLDKIEKRG